MSYLIGGHVTDWAVCLYGLQLIQTPVQLLHGLHSQLLVGLICQQTHGHVIRSKRIHVHSRASRDHVCRSEGPGVARSYGRSARWTSGRRRGRGGGVYAQFLHLASLHRYLRKFRKVVCSDKLRLELLFADSLSLKLLSSRSPSFPLHLCTLQTPSHSVWFPHPLSGLSSLFIPRLCTTLLNEWHAN